MRPLLFHKPARLADGLDLGSDPGIRMGRHRSPHLRMFIGVWFPRAGMGSRLRQHTHKSKCRKNVNSREQSWLTHCLMLC